MIADPIETGALAMATSEDNQSAAGRGQRALEVGQAVQGAALAGAQATQAAAHAGT